MARCGWCGSDPLYIAYHDEEWGVPIKSAQKLFEMLILESMQAGLSWYTVLKKRETMRTAFHDFSPEKLAVLSDGELKQLTQCEGIIRNTLKINSLKKNAQAFLNVSSQRNVVDYFWQFTDHQVIQNKPKDLSEVPAQTEASTRMAKQLKKDGFSFMGPTTCYAFMQAVGMVNDHVQNCFRWRPLAK